MLFNADGKIRRYALDSARSEHGSTEESALDILKEFADVRLAIYETFGAMLFGLVGESKAEGSPLGPADSRMRGFVLK